jgi:hypothetical protein
VSAASGCIIELYRKRQQLGYFGERGRTLAALSFRADDDPDSFYFKVLTNLNQCLAAQAFDGQDAYYFDFVVIRPFRRPPFPRLRFITLIWMMMGNRPLNPKR